MSIRFLASSFTGLAFMKLKKHLVMPALYGSSDGPEREVESMSRKQNGEGRLRWGARGAAAPSAFFYGSQEEQELPFILSSFYSSPLFSYVVNGHFPAL